MKMEEFTVYICNKCGKIISGTDEMIPIDVRRGWQSEFDGMIINPKIHLCTECADEWMKTMACWEYPPYTDTDEE